MKRSTCLYKHQTARRPSWSKDSHIYLSADKKLYFSSTMAPYQPTLDDEMAVDFEPYVAPVKDQGYGHNDASFGKVSNGVRYLSRADLVTAINRAVRKNLVVGPNEIADELGLEK